MVIGTALSRSNFATIVPAVVLTLVSSDAFAMVPQPRAGMAFDAVAWPALAADMASVAIMEVVDTTVMPAIPGAMHAPKGRVLFWGSLALAIAAVLAFPVNRWLIDWGRGHAVGHAHHGPHRVGAGDCPPKLIDRPLTFHCRDARPTGHGTCRDETAMRSRVENMACGGCARSVAKAIQ